MRTGDQSFRLVLTDAGFDELMDSDFTEGFGDTFLHYPYTDGGRDEEPTNSLHFLAEFSLP